MDANALYGHVNDAIRRLAVETPPGETWQFFCECPDVTCHALVTLTLVEFDARRAALPPVSIRVPGHDHRGN